MSAPGYYILGDDGAPRQVDALTWATWYETASETRRVAHDVVGAEVAVSTAFLSLDHNFGDVGPPVLWETMIFGGPNDGYQARYTSLADALAGHARIVELAKNDHETHVSAVVLGRQGGLARAKSLSPEARTAIAHKAARARWDKRQPRH